MKTRAMACLGSLTLAACSAAPSGGVPYAAKAEKVVDFGALLQPANPRQASPGRVRLERITAGVPWPRGLAWVDGKLIVLARGRHRNAGGIDPSIPDLSGTLMAVDPEVAEPILAGEFASKTAQQNAVVLAPPTDPPFNLYDASVRPAEDTRMDRPYCTLIHDAASQNIFVCGYSGADLPGRKFRKNASDSILRHDLRTGRWSAVELHDAASVPEAQLGYVVPNQYYPHHDPNSNPPPHGWLNGPDGGCVAGRYLYCVGKDNHTIAQYDISALRTDSNAPPPPSKKIFGSRARVRTPLGEREIELLGPSAAVAHQGYIYLGYRTSSVVVRFPIAEDGDIVTPTVGELIAVFEPWDAKRKRSANLIDLAINSRGELFVSCAKEGKIWKVGKPDPRRVFYGNDQGTEPTTAPPYVDLRQFTGKKTGCGNILFDDQDRLYICVGNYDAGNTLAGAVYRAVEID